MSVVDIIWLRKGFTDLGFIIYVDDKWMLVVYVGDNFGMLMTEFRY